MFKKIGGVVAAIAIASGVGMGAAFAIDTPIHPQPNYDHDHHPTLEDAKKQVPFTVLTPSELPENYELSAFTLIEAPTSGGKVSDENPMKVTGIALYYEDTSQSGGPTRDAIFFEQFLGGKAPGYQVVHGTKAGQRTVLGGSADLWTVRHSKGSQSALVWEDTDKGVFYGMVTYLDPDETLKMARSLQ